MISLRKNLIPSHNDQLSTNKFANTYWLALLIFLANVGFKFIHLTTEPIWYDECFSIFFGQQSIDEILFVSTWEPPPPLFNLGLHYWISLFGISELGVRLLPLLVSSLAGSVLYLFLNKFTSSKIALTASVLYLFSELSFYYAQEVRCYSSILLMSVISLWLFIELFSKPRFIIALFLGLSYYILMMTHYLAFFILLFQGILFLLFINKSFLKYYLVGVLTFLLLIKNWMPRMWEVASGNSNSHWMIIPDKNLLAGFLLNINNGFNQLFILCMLSIIGIISIYIKKTVFFQSIEEKAIFIYSILISIVTTLLSFFVSQSIPMFVDRYLLFTLIGFIMFFAMCISHLPFKNYIYIPLIITIGAYSCFQVKLNGPIRKMDYRSAAAYVKKHEDSTSATFIQTVDVTTLFIYYYDRQMFKDYSNLEQNRTAKKIFQGNDSIQLAKALDDSFNKIIHVETYSNYSDPNKTVVAWFKRHGYKKVEEENAYNEVQLSVYEKIH